METALFFVFKLLTFKLNYLTSQKQGLYKFELTKLLTIVTFVYIYKFNNLLLYCLQK